MVVKIVNLKRYKIGHRPQLWWWGFSDPIWFECCIESAEQGLYASLEVRLEGMVDSIVLIKSI